MNEKQKVKLIFEFERTKFEALCFLIGKKMPDDLWNKLCAGPVICNCDTLDEDGRTVELLIASIAMLTMEKQNMTRP